MAPRFVIAPLVYDTGVIGVLCVTEGYEEGPFDKNDQAYMEVFSKMAGQIAHNRPQNRAADEPATIDKGTQLFNRIFPQQVIRRRRYQHDLTLASIDVDDFKLYDDPNATGPASVRRQSCRAY